MATRRTRLVGTIGPASSSHEMLTKLIGAGLDIARLNYSHGTLEGKSELISKLRKVEEESKRPLGILADLPGPKLRLGEFEGTIDLEIGQEVIFACGEKEGITLGACPILPVPYGGLSKSLRESDPILLADGIVRLRVIDAPGIAKSKVRCVVEDGGPMSSRKGINVPDTVVDLPAIGEKDKLALEHALDHEVDFIAVSYVRSAIELEPVINSIKARELRTPIISKIEHPAALQHLDEILDKSDAVMVARGDLGVEIPLEKVPAAQERILRAGMERGMPVIIATQMLESMCVNPRPTRAEVTDVATAIRHGASAVMLSGETASGNYPLESIQTMHKIAESVEEEMTLLERAPALAKYRSTRAVANAAVELAIGANVKRMIVATEHCTAPRLVASYRPKCAITAMTHRIRACRRSTIFPGVDTVLVDELESSRDTLELATKKLLEDGRLLTGDRIVTVTGSPLAMSGASNTIRLMNILESGELSDLE